MGSWVHIAWANRERIVAVARKLKWPLRVWVGVAAAAALVGALYWAATAGLVRWTSPAEWATAQWVLVVVNVLGFTVLYVTQRTWWSRVDEVWDEVDMLRDEVAELRELLHGSTPVPQPQPFAPETSPQTINAIPSARPAPPAPKPRPVDATQSIPVVRAEPVGNEPATVERQLGGRTFNFRQVG